MGGTAFGILRDPYERLVAQFRGTYRLQHPEFQCDANAAVRFARRVCRFLRDANAPPGIRFVGLVVPGA